MFYLTIPDSLSRRYDIFVTYNIKLKKIVLSKYILFIFILDSNFENLFQRIISLKHKLETSRNAALFILFCLVFYLRKI